MRCWSHGAEISTRLVSKSLSTSPGVVMVFYTKKSDVETSAGTNTCNPIRLLGKSWVQNNVIVISLETPHLVDKSALQVLL